MNDQQMKRLTHAIAQIKESVGHARKALEEAHDDVVEKLDEAGEDDDTNDLSSKESDYGSAIDCLDSIDNEIDDLVSYSGVTLP